MCIASWLLITGSGLDDWGYWHLLLQSLLITINYSTVANLHTSQITRTRCILVLILWLTPLHSCSILLQLPASEFDSLITMWHGPHGKHSLLCWWSLFTMPLHSSRYPSIVESVCFMIVFIELLPNNGSTCHSILNFIKLDKPLLQEKY
jgi:hypothetical protein